MAAYDHKRCAGHIRHPAFSKRLCWQAGETEQDARAFADEVAARKDRIRDLARALWPATAASVLAETRGGVYHLQSTLVAPDAPIRHDWRTS